MAPKAELIAKLAGEPVKPADPTPENSPPPVTEGGEEGGKTNDKVVNPELESTRFASIAKREAKLQKDREELKTREEAIKGLETEYQTKLTPFQQFEVLRSSDPVAALKSLGFSETDVFNWLANAETKKEPTVEERAAAAAREEIKSENDRRSAVEKEASDKRDKETITRFRGEITNFFKTPENADKYQFCAFEGALAEEAVFKLVDQVLKDSGEMISLEEAAQTMDEFYENDHKERQAKVKKLQVVTPAPETLTLTEASPPPAAPAPKPKTLTNAATATVAATANRRETREQKRARLEEALRNGGIAKAA